MKHNPQRGNGIVLVIFAVLVVAAVIGVGVALQSRTKPHPAVTVTGNTSASLFGTSISPKSYDRAGITDYFERAVQLGNAVEWQGDWNELGQQGTGASLVAGSAGTYGYEPVLVVSAFKDGGNSTSVPIRPLTASQIAAYVARARDFVQANRPKYFGIGAEVNRIYETSPENYRQFVSLFSQTADAIHSVSPTTKVFPSFQLERLKGLRGGLYGGTNDASSSEWGLLADFPRADMVAFTSYPALIYKKPADVSVNYYQEITKHTSKPVGFTEIGWPAADEAAGWPSSAADQVQFTKDFSASAKTLGAQVTIWSFLYDQQVKAPFNHMGLLNADGSKRPAWQQFTQ